MTDICTLPSRALIRIGGADAHGWLQDLITNDMGRLEKDGGLYTALLSPQGKILFDFFIYPGATGFLLDCEAAQSDALLKRLSIYRMRSDVTLEAAPDLGVMASCTPLEKPHAFVACSARDPRLEALGYRLVGDMGHMTKAFEDAGHTVQGEASYCDYLLKLGVANGSADFAGGKAYPAEFNFEELNGISFSKGCFIGQEVSARMKHKSELKKRLLPLTSKGGTLVAGADIVAGSTKVGAVISAHGAAGLGLVRLVEWRAAMAQKTPLQAGDTPLTISAPGWLNLN